MKDDPNSFFFGGDGVEEGRWGSAPCDKDAKFGRSKSNRTGAATGSKKFGGR